MIRYKTFNFITFETIPSTHAWTKQHHTTFDTEKFTCITAEEQTAGQGQYQRPWHSPKHVNLYTTLHFCLPKHFPHYANLSQLLTLSLCKVLEKLSFSPHIKWPNDLLLSDKKVGGILCDLIEHNNTIHVILSFGLNVNMTLEQTKSIDQPATSLLCETHKPWSCSDLLQHILEQFVQDLSLLEAKGFHLFHTYYESLFLSKGKHLRVQQRDVFIEGLCLGISSNGKLLLQLPDHTVTEISSGIIQA